MITNDIQELLDGSLGDEQMAEMLHTLSVSPEKRSALRQHLALRSTMERDRAAAALSSTEEATIWGAVAAATGLQAPATSGMAAAGGARAAGWMARAATLVVVGVVGYLLGSNQITNLFGSDAAEPTVAVTTTQKPAATPQSNDSAPVEEFSATNATAEQPIASINTTASPVTTSVGSEARQRTSFQTRQNGSGGNTPPDTSVSPIAQTIPSSASPVQVQTSIDSDRRVVELLEELVKEPVVVAQTLPQQPAPQLKHDPRQPMEELSVPTSSLFTSGFEVAFGERVGRIAPTPAGIDDPDPDFSNRSLDVSYRFPTAFLLPNSSIGIGVRGSYGTFSSVSLEAKPVADIGIVTFQPKLKAEMGWTGEIFANYRQPIWSWLALGIEGSFTASETYQKTGGDLFLLGFITDRIGVQAGVGYGQYRYNLSDQRDQLFREHPNAGITSEASDSYQGAMIEGRYGLFYRF